MNLSRHEKGIIEIVRLNKSTKEIAIRKKITFWRLEIRFVWKSKKNLHGRFGGGWNWKLGFQSAGKTIIFSLLICAITFHVIEKRQKEC